MLLTADSTTQGRRVYLWLAGGLAIILVACSGSQSAEPPGKAYHPTWSPGGDRVAYTCFEDGPLERDELGGVSFTTDAAELCVMKADGTNKHRLTRNQSFDFVPSWSPDGTVMAYVAADGLYVTSPQGSDARRLFEGRTLVWDDPQWSPDGSRIAVSVCRADDHGSDIFILDQDDGQFIRLGNATGATIDSPRWSPDGRRLAYRLHSTPTCGHVGGGQAPHNLLIVDVQQATPPVKLLDTLPAASRFIWKDDDTIVYSLYQGNTSSDIYQINLSSGASQVVKQDIGYLWALHGNFLAYEIRGARTTLAVEDLMTGKVTTIFESVYGALEIEWSPDGRWLLVNMMEIVPAEPEDIFAYTVWLFSRDGEYSQRLTPFSR